jgi:hypothetical protein
MAATAAAAGTTCNPVKTASFRSPILTAQPGEVNNKYFVGEAPKGHIGIVNFVADLVYDNGEKVPLSDVYLHHWVMLEVLVPKKHSERHLHHFLKDLKKRTARDGMMMHHMHNHHAKSIASYEAPTGNRKIGAGLRRKKVLNFFGKGGETRKTVSALPAPYVVESGNPNVVTEEFVNAWILNVHGLDARGAVDAMGCSECRCALFNATADEEGKPLPEGYIGGLRCCGDEMRCAVKDDFNGGEISFHLEYKWEYVEWDSCVKPVKTFGLDITNHNGYEENLVEFTVDGCGDADPNSDECVDTRVAYLDAPMGGDVVHALSHLHAAALNATLWGEDGRLLCETSPIYGQGNEAGNEKGYVVGIKGCYGNPGTPNALKIVKGEKLKYIVRSSKVNGPHTGLMGLGGFFIDEKVDESELSVLRTKVQDE